MSFVNFTINLVKLTVSYDGYNKLLDTLDNILLSGVRSVAVYDSPDYDKIFGPNHVLTDAASFGTGLAISGTLVLLEYTQKLIRGYQNSNEYLEEIVEKEEFQQDFFNEEKLQELADTLFKRKYNVSVERHATENTSDNENNNSNQHEKTSIKLTRKEKRAKKEESRFKKNIANLSSGFSFFWNNLVASYDSGFWVSWYISWIIFGTNVAFGSLAIGMNFGLPLIPPALYGLWKLGKWAMPWLKKEWYKFSDSRIKDEQLRKKIQEEREKKEAEKELQLSNDKHQIRLQHLIKVRLLQMHYDRENKKLGINKDLRISSKTGQEKNEKTAEKAFNNKLNILKSRVATYEKKLDAVEKKKSTIPQYAERLLGKRWLHSKLVKIATSVTIAFISQYILAFFTTWPITNLLVGLGVITLAASGGPASIAIVFGVSLLAGLIGATFAGYNKYQEIKRNEECVTNKMKEINTQNTLHPTTDTDNHANDKNILEELKHAKNINRELRALANFQYKKLEKMHHNEQKQLIFPKITENNLIQCKPKILNKAIDKAQDFERNKFLPGSKPGWKAKAAHYSDKIINYALTIKLLFPAWTGSLFNRSLLAGGFVMLFIPHVGLPVFAGVGAGCAVLFVSWLALNYYLQKRETQDKQLVEEAAGNLLAIQTENEYLMNLCAKQATLAPDDLLKPAGSTNSQPVANLQPRATHRHSGNLHSTAQYLISDNIPTVSQTKATQEKDLQASSCTPLNSKIKYSPFLFGLCTEKQKSEKTFTKKEVASSLSAHRPPIIG